MDSGRKNKSYYILGVITFALALLILFPILYCLSISLMAPSDIISYPPKFFPKSLYLYNYVTVFTSTGMPRFVFNSLLLALCATLMRIITSSLAAYAFAFYKFRFKKLLFFLILGSMVIPGDALIVSNYLTVASLNLLDTYLGVMIIYFSDAMYMFMLRQFMLTLPSDFRDAAMIDGCGNFKFFTSIIMPICQPAVVSIFISSFVGLWNAYIWPLLVTNTPEMRTVQVGIITLNSNETTSFGPIMAGSIVILIPVIIVFIVFKEKIISGITAGSLKG